MITISKEDYLKVIAEAEAEGRSVGWAHSSHKTRPRDRRAHDCRHHLIGSESLLKRDRCVFAAKLTVVNLMNNSKEPGWSRFGFAVA